MCPRKYNKIFSSNWGGGGMKYILHERYFKHLILYNGLSALDIWDYGIDKWGNATRPARKN